MVRRLLAGILAAAVLAASVFAIARFERPLPEMVVAVEVEGDVDDAFSSIATADLPDVAAGLLNTDRPWRAARMMRAYMERVDTVAAEHRLLAARSEAGWGNWPDVLKLLQEVPVLEGYGNGIGLYLLGRARDEAGDARGAVDAYRSFLALSPPAGELEEERAAARLRLGLALLRVGERAAARETLAASAVQAGGASQWFRLLEADALAKAGDTAGVQQAVAGFDGRQLRLRAWRYSIEAAREAGDLTAARRLAERAVAWANTKDTRAEFLLESARAALQAGDVTAGRAALRRAIALDAGSIHAQAAAELLRDGKMSPGDHLSVARVLTAQGLHDQAVEGYEQWLKSGEGTAAQRAGVHLEHAEALFYAERYEDVEESLQPVAGRTQAQMLQARAAGNGGETDEAVRIYLSIAQRQPNSDTGVLALLLAAAARHDAGDTEAARELYLRFVRQHPRSSYAGLATMRLAGMAFLDKRYEEAARVWDEYRSSNPRGALVQQATYWSGRAHEAQGNSATAETRYRKARAGERDSYYALLASQRLGEPFWPLPMAAMPPDDPAAARRVRRWMDGVDLLRNAGFPEAASLEVDRIVDGAGGNQATLYALAEALAERGYSQRAIRIGLQLSRSGPPNRRLLAILYPFPFRRLITEEANERGVDPAVAAALIRQESMFEVRNTSHVGARGLMQIMPATGRQLAEAVGIERWDPEMLYHPEINVHLGMRYVAQHSKSYDGSLPSVFSAYNAGPHRVDEWKAFPEYGEDELFTERIPFRETRDYVKILTRNRAIYQGLYGDR